VPVKTHRLLAAVAVHPIELFFSVPAVVPMNQRLAAAERPNIADSVTAQCPGSYFLVGD
jgi:hypothetical protein